MPVLDAAVVILTFEWPPSRPGQQRSQISVNSRRQHLRCGERDILSPRLDERACGFRELCLGESRFQPRRFQVGAERALPRLNCSPATVCCLI